MNNVPFCSILNSAEANKVCIDHLILDFFQDYEITALP